MQGTWPFTGAFHSPPNPFNDKLISRKVSQSFPQKISILLKQMHELKEHLYRTRGILSINAEICK